jgi:ABC-type uncharacterized transport system substrate-binding protein
LKDIISKLKRVAVLASAIAPDRAQTMNEMESAAKALRLELEFLDVSGSQDVEPAFYTLANRTPGALVVLARPTVIRRMTQITGLAANRRLPVIYHQSEFVDAGGLISYGVNLSDLYRRTAIYVDKILKGGSRPICHAECRTGVHKKLNVFNAPRWSGQTTFYEKQIHIKDLPKNEFIVVPLTYKTNPLTVPPNVWRARIGVIR